MGDSICEQCRDDEYPRAGWGMFFGYHLMPGYTVQNFSHSGWTTKTYLTANHDNHFPGKSAWDVIIESVKEGDWVIVALGVNDASVVNEYRTDEQTYRQNLTLFTNEIRKKGADVVFVTLTLRGGDDGSELGWDYEYTDDPADPDMDKRWMRRTKVLCDIAADLDVKVLGMGVSLKKIYEDMYQDYMSSHKDATQSQGRDYVRYFFHLYNKPLNTPVKDGGFGLDNPDKKDDSTHLNIRGAKVYAKTVAKLIKQTDTGFAKWIDETTL